MAAAASDIRSQNNTDDSRVGRRLVLHADDFGMNAAVNRGILQGFLHGLLTSTSVLSNAPALSGALQSWHELTGLQASGKLPSSASRALLGDRGQPFDLGVHLNLTQGRPLTGRRFPEALLDRQGRFPGVFSLLPRLLAAGRRYRQAIRAELGAQVERVLDHGIVPTHLNGHQYVEMLPVVAGLIPELLKTYRIGAVRVAWERGLTQTTLRGRFRPAAWSLAQVKRLFAFDLLLRMRRTGAGRPATYFGTAHAGRVDLDAIRQFLELADGGLTEIGIHPGEAGDDPAGLVAEGWDDPLAKLRPVELQSLTSQELLDLLVNLHVDLGRLAECRAVALRCAA